MAGEPVLHGEVAEQIVAELQTALGLPTLGAVGPQVCRVEETRAVGQVPLTHLAPLLGIQIESAWELPEGPAEPMCQQNSVADTVHLFICLITFSLFSTVRSTAQVFSVHLQTGPLVTPRLNLVGL